MWPPIEKLLRALTWPILALVILLSELIACGVLDAWLRAHFGWRSDEPSMLRQTTFTPICLGVLLAHTLHSAARLWRGVARAALGLVGAVPVRRARALARAASG